MCHALPRHDTWYANVVRHPPYPLNNNHRVKRMYTESQDNIKDKDQKESIRTYRKRAVRWMIAFGFIGFFLALQFGILSLISGFAVLYGFAIIFGNEPLVLLPVILLLSTTYFVVKIPKTIDGLGRMRLFGSAVYGVLGLLLGIVTNAWVSEISSHIGW